MRQAIFGTICAAVLAVLLAGCSSFTGPEPKNGVRDPAKATLFEAARYGDFGRVQFLVSQGADVTAADKHGRTALHFAVMSGKSEIAEYLVKHGAKVNVQDDKGRTPLHIAAQMKNEAIEKILLDNGADRTLPDIYGRVPGDRTKISRKEMNARKRQERAEKKNKTVKGGRKIKFR